jgi:hypothetical protein
MNDQAIPPLGCRKIAIAATIRVLGVNAAIPVLRQVASLPKHNECTSSTFDAAARTALAKLGDENAYAAIKQQWAQQRTGPYPARIAFIGDDWTLQTLVEFLIQHANDPGIIVQSGRPTGLTMPAAEYSRKLGESPGDTLSRTFRMPTTRPPGLRSGRHGLGNTRDNI